MAFIRNLWNVGHHFVVGEPSIALFSETLQEVFQRLSVLKHGGFPLFGNDDMNFFETCEV